MTDIYEEHIEQTFQEAVDVYKPSVAVLHGEHDGEEYTVEVRERELPEGTPPSKAININLIEWDEAFYLEWEDDGGLVNSYDILVEDSNDSVVSEIEGREEQFAKYEDLPGSFPQNGEEYAFTITSIFFTESLTADEVLGTGEDKTPQNLSQTINEDSESELSWDGVSGDVIGYRIKIKDSDTGDILNTVGIITSTSHVLKPTAKRFLDIVVVAVSTQKIFESSESNVVNIYSNEVIQNFSVILDIDNEQFSSTWDSLSGADGYNIYRKPPNGVYQKVNSNLITGTSFSGDISKWSNGKNSLYIIPVKNSTEGINLSNIEEVEIDRIISSWNESDNISIDGFTFNASPIDESWNESDGTSETLNTS